ncbi:phospholipid-translocating P-type ATPase, flippase [Necator americanus]|uniref:Phospholipid-translocating P-type ATPase, flippase n=1 Tax=Necator americanus TaxID=51031 RepID=W2T516_NECAM|nr:phospholipid-translocating P-type ATPase, flippase [Necator americanus]ETN77125.1 phospholipid-translocating P-type ATPase, flippase [Necator americanus]
MEREEKAWKCLRRHTDIVPFSFNRSSHDSRLITAAIAPATSADNPVYVGDPEKKPIVSSSKSPSMFDRLCGCCRHEASASDDVIVGEEERRLRANDRAYNSRFKYADNYIKTSKYNIITFIPHNLFEQFQRIANFYFLVLMILQFIPQISSISWYSTAIPLVIVLAFSAIKDGYDDVQRHISDRNVNGRKSYVVRNGHLNEEEWSNVRVGDVIRMMSNQFVAADLLLLSTSEPHGICYIETMELDGETNLKTRGALPDTAEMGDDLVAISKFNGEIVCEAPNNKLDKFQGKLIWQEREMPITNDNILLRGCILKNTRWCYGLVIFAGKDTKLMMNSGKSKFKRTSLDRFLNILIMGVSEIYTNYLYFPLFFFSKRLELASNLPRPSKIVLFLIAMCLICTVLCGVWEWTTGRWFTIYLPWDDIVPNRHQHGTDKTGTLTRNIMTFNKCTINGVCYGDVISPSGEIMEITSETAINIAYSCRLLTDDMKEIVVIDGQTHSEVEVQLKDTKTTFDRIMNNNNSQSPIMDKPRFEIETIHGNGQNSTMTYGVANSKQSPSEHQRDGGVALVINGDSLGFALDQRLERLFLEIATMYIFQFYLLLLIIYTCNKNNFLQAVICCRVTPLQKAQVVDLVKRNKKAVTLSIGDGANDVSMIKTAHIGVGISGQEGMQAVLASDYSIGQFRYLERLLLVHGRWSYIRMAKFLRYFFYKNFAFTLTHFWYSFFCGYSAQTVFDAVFIACYNLFFTALPVLAMGSLDQDVDDNYSLHSLVIFFIPYGALLNGAAYDGKDLDDYSTLAFTTFTALIVVVTGQIAFDTAYWTAINHFVIWGSLIFYLLLAFLIYEALPVSLVAKTSSTISYGVAFKTMATPQFWFSILMVTVILLLPVMLNRFFWLDTHPSFADRLRVRRSLGKRAVSVKEKEDKK